MPNPTSGCKMFLRSAVRLSVQLRSRIFILPKSPLPEEDVAGPMM